MSITDPDKIRFQERLYDHVRGEMIEHIKHRRALALATIVGSFVLFSWLWSDGTGIAAKFPPLKFAPIAVFVLGVGAIGAINSKIKIHGSYLRMIEDNYENNSMEVVPSSLFVGFEKFHGAKLERSRFASERNWLGFAMSVICIVIVFLTVAVS